MDKKIFNLFDDYARAENSKRKFTLASGSSYFEFYIFTKKCLDIIKELDILNSL